MNAILGMKWDSLTNHYQKKSKLNNLYIPIEKENYCKRKRREREKAIASEMREREREMEQTRAWKRWETVREREREREKAIARERSDREIERAN